MYIHTYNLHKQVCTFENIGRLTCVLTYLLSQVPTKLFMKKIEIEMLLYTLTKKFTKVEGSMLMHLDHIVLQNGGPRHR